MKTISRIAAALALSVPALALTVPALAAPAQAPKKTADVFPTKCVVTGETIQSEKDAVGKSVYKGKTYYFCCTACKPEFDKDPTKFVHPAAPKTAAP